MNNLIVENIRISLDAIRSHLLRSILTVMIIAFGIMALVGILTAIDSIKYSLTENFAMMGSNSFTIRNRDINIQIGNTRSRNKRFKSITFKEAMDFKQRFDFQAYTSVFTMGSNIATIKYESEKTDPKITTCLYFCI